MITVNTNLASLLVQKNFKNSTNSLNTAIERLTTGFRINSAKDDAVGKAVSIDMDVKLSSNEVVQNNVAMGISMLNTAEGNVNLIKNSVQRCRNLCEQALNGVYDTESQDAVKAELTQIVAQINQTKSTAEFNGISLFEGGSPSVAQTGFKAAVETQNATVVIDETATTVAEAESTLRTALNQSGAVIGISNELGLKALANVVNGTNGSANNCSGKTIVLTNNIDLSTVGNWTSIGKIEYDEDLDDDICYAFSGNFNGCGHSILNMTVTGTDYVGLFGYIEESTISNTALINATVSGTGGSVGGLVGGASGSSVTNSYTTGSVSGTNNVGGLVGVASGNSSVTNSYATGSVSGTGGSVGGLVGYALINSSVTNSYATGSVSGTNNVGGLVGGASGSSVTNSYVTGFVSGTNEVGGLVGHAYNSSVTNSYVTGFVSGTNQVGGLVGFAYNNSSVTNSYATGTVSGTVNVGGLVGYAGDSSVTNSYVTGFVSGTNQVGGLVGGASGSSVTDSTAYTNVSGTGSYIGGFLGVKQSNTTTFSNNAYVDDSPGRAIGNVSGLNPTGVTLDTSATPPSSGGSGITLQIGLDGGVNSQITLNLGLDLGSLNSILSTPSSASNISTLDSILSQITSVETQIGAGLNRLESVQDSLLTQQKTLTAARSIVMDADVSQESARYIRSQILQQASASLLTVANQSPSLLLSLINGMIR